MYNWIKLNSQYVTVEDTEKQATCMLNLNEVDYFEYQEVWDGTDGRLIIHLKSNATIITNSYTMDDFIELMKNKKILEIAEC